MIANIVKYDFMMNAFMIGFLISLILPFIGVVVLMRRQTFIADALGHINMSGIAFSMFLGSIFASFEDSIGIVVIIWSILGAILIEYLRNKFKENKEVSLVIVYSMSVALTMIFLNLSTGYNASFFNVLFGNINAISSSEIKIMFVMEVVIFIIMFFTYKKILLLSMEEEHIKMYGINVTFYRYLTMILVTLVITMAIKVIGVLLVSSLITIPLLAAVRIAKNLKQTIIISIIINEISMLGGIIIAYYLNLSTSAVVVLIALFLYLLTVIFYKNN
jgi:zinc transport system permease protein